MVEYSPPAVNWVSYPPGKKLVVLSIKSPPASPLCAYKYSKTVRQANGGRSVIGITFRDKLLLNGLQCASRRLRVYHTYRTVQRRPAQQWTHYCYIRPAIYVCSRSNISRPSQNPPVNQHSSNQVWFGVTSAILGLGPMLWWIFGIFLCLYTSSSGALQYL
jgi:hypothetical protein